MAKKEPIIIKTEPTSENLDLKEFKGVLKQYTEDGELIYIMTSNYRPMACPQCGNAKLHKHNPYTRRVRDKSVSGYPVGIIIQGNRYRCPQCGKVVVPEYPSLHKSSKMTERLWREIALESFNDKIENVMRRYRLSSGMVRNIFHERLDDLNRKTVLKTPRVLGIDEVHLHKRYSGVFVDVEKGRIIEMTANRKKDDIIATLKSMKNKENLECVTIDMWKPYAEAVREVFGKDTPVVIDHFHVTKEVMKAFEVIRRKITREIKNRKKRASLKNARFLLLANSEELSIEKANQAMQLLDDFPEFGGPYALKEAFRDIYDAETRKDAEEIYNEWKEAVIEEAALYEQEELQKSPDKYIKSDGTVIKPHYPFFDVLDTISNWHEEIFAYFDHRYTNAGTEALNRVIRDIDREGRGYSFDVLRGKALYSIRKRDQAGESSFIF